MKTRRLPLWVTTFLALAVAASAGPLPPEENPAAPGFDLEGSDPAAIELADRVMEAMGGRDAWDATRHLRWRFFGRRLHVWDKHTGNIRVEGVERDSDEPYVILMNLETGRGRAWRGGSEITDETELAEMLDRGEATWINDSYWVFMPYKLKDTGVTLRHLGERRLADGRAAEALELTFRDVGRTPENKYVVSVGRESGLVEQWDFYATASDPEPRFTNPWANWQRYGDILLSDDRGDTRHTDLAVFDELPEAVYADPAPIDWDQLP